MILWKFKLSFIVLLLGLVSCEKGKYSPICNDSNPTYESHISFIVNSSCMGSSCHNVGSKRGDFSVYDSMKPSLEDGKFEYHVLTKQDMPRDKKLSEQDLNIIQCWMENEYPER